MKNIALLAALILPLSASASDENTDRCAQYSDFAGNVMKSRQNEVAISKLMKIAKESFDAKYLHTYTDVIVEAYSKPAYSTEKYKTSAIEKFKTKYYLSCYKTMNS